MSARCACGRRPQAQVRQFPENLPAAGIIAAFDCAEASAGSAGSSAATLYRIGALR
jgi:hypothetical protein